MKVIKISPQGQITIPRSLRALCHTGLFGIYTEGQKIILTPLEIKPKKSEDEILQELIEDVRRRHAN